MAEHHPVPPDVQAGISLIERLSGIVVPEYRWPILREQLERIGEGEDLDSALSRVAAGDPSARSAVFAASSIPETYMFRHSGHFDLLAELAERRRRHGLPTTVLSAGCSTGEEAWSAAAVLSCLPLDNGLRHRVEGWDLCPDRVHRATEARYSEWARRSGLETYGHCFEDLHDCFTVRPQLRELTSFRTANLVSDIFPPDNKYDVVFFRNVAIYWTEDTVSAVCHKLAQLVAPDGAIFAGPSDPIVLSDDTWQQSLKHRVRSYWLHSEPRPKVRRPAKIKSAAPARPVRIDIRSSTTKAAAAQRPEPIKKSAPKPPDAPGFDPLDSRLEEIRQLADNGRYNEALEILGDETVGATVEGKMWRGILMLATEREEEAIGAFRQCVFLEPREEEYRRWLAVAYEAVGRTTEADRERRNAAELRKP